MQMRDIMTNTMKKSLASLLEAKDLLSWDTTKVPKWRRDLWDPLLLCMLSRVLLSLQVPFPVFQYSIILLLSSSTNTHTTHFTAWRQYLFSDSLVRPLVAMREACCLLFTDLFFLLQLHFSHFLLSMFSRELLPFKSFFPVVQINHENIPDKEQEKGHKKQKDKVVTKQLNFVFLFSEKSRCHEQTILIWRPQFEDHEEQPSFPSLFVQSCFLKRDVDSE